jgi:hypothetical protein
VLKPPQSKRWRDGLASPKHAKRLDCGAFTAAFLWQFEMPGMLRLVLRPHSGSETAAA